MFKKIFIGMTTLLMLFAVVTPAHGGLESEIREDLRDIRSRTEKLLKDVEDLLEGDTVIATFPGIPDNFRFTRHLRFRDYGDDVKYLQIILNADPVTRLANTGVGSPGNEVERFGNITLNALKRFQQKYAAEILHPWGINEPTGVAEIQTIKKLNKILEGDVLIQVVNSEKEAQIKAEILKLLADIRALRLKLDRLDDVEEGSADAPTNVRGAIIGYGEVRLTWRGDRNAEYFVGYKATRSGGTRTEAGVTQDTKGIISGLEYGKTYYLTVTQVVKGKESGHSREVQVTMDWEPTPFNIKGEATDIGEITFTWETDQRDVDGYKLYRAMKAGGPYTKIGETNREEFRDSGLQLYTIYYYVITQVIDGKESDFSGEHVDSWFYNWQGGVYPHPEKEKILDNLDYNL